MATAIGSGDVRYRPISLPSSRPCDGAKSARTALAMIFLSLTASRSHVNLLLIWLLSSIMRFDSMWLSQAAFYCEVQKECHTKVCARQFQGNPRLGVVDKIHTLRGFIRILMSRSLLLPAVTSSRLANCHANILLVTRGRSQSFFNEVDVRSRARRRVRIFRSIPGCFLVSFQATPCMK